MGFQIFFEGIWRFCAQALLYEKRFRNLFLNIILQFNYLSIRVEKRKKGNFFVNLQFLQHLSFQFSIFSFNFQLQFSVSFSAPIFLLFVFFHFVIHSRLLKKENILFFLIEASMKILNTLKNLRCQRITFFFGGWGGIKKKRKKVEVSNFSWISFEISFEILFEFHLSFI